MTYSSGNLDETVPGQGEFARLGAGRIRTLTLALKERLASIFQDPDADPLQFKPIPGDSLKSAVHEYDFTGLFPSPSLVAGGTALLSTASTYPAGSPVIAVWRVCPITDTERANTMINAFHDGTNLKFNIKNTSGSAINYTGCILSMFSISRS